MELSLRENVYNNKLPSENLSILDICDKKEGKHSDANNSTLSLHIAAYENSNEASNSSQEDEEDFKVKESGLTKQCKNAKQIFPDSPLVFQIEFPRQHENRNMKPEMMRFKASQKLLNPNSAEGNFVNANV
uniref:Uncharacterized protein n=1 Tax=Panagrolaimus sp. ES5 TaxID=591445 RepID=A0AC34FM02_9BILA